MPRIKKTTCWLGENDDRKKYFVEDADESITITVRRSDYVQGSCGNASSCALSRALKRGNKDVLFAFTGLTFAYVVFKSNPSMAVRYSVPSSQRDAINAFDKTGYMHPGTYRFNVVAPSHRLGYKIGKSGTTTRRGVVKNVRNTRAAIERITPTRRVMTGRPHTA